jgi:hypothetical protein
LKQYPGPVTGDFVGTGGTSMMEVDDNLFGVFDDPMVCRAVDVYNGPDTAGIMFTSALVQTLISKHFGHILFCNSLLLILNKYSFYL